jgi:hypothetical protein
MHGTSPIGTDWSPTPGRGPSRPRINVVLLVVIFAAASAALPLGMPAGGQSVRGSTPAASAAGTVHVIDQERVHHRVTTTPTTAPGTPPSTSTTTTAPIATAPALATGPAATAPTARAAAVTPQPIGPSVAALVAEVEAAGVDPGANWHWSIANTATQCGIIPGNNVATGCTFGAAGIAQSVFTGSPSLALVAHELANAETENDAVPNLISEVATAEAGASWSPIDAVASCLVENFMGFQDVAAGTWQCPAPLATLVAENIHNSGFTTTDVPPS